MSKSYNKGSKNGMWKGGGVERICEECKKPFIQTDHPHNRVQKFCSKRCGKLGSSNPNFNGAVAAKGSRHPQWKGDNVGIDALHTYVRKRLPKPEKCQCCNDAPPYDLANISNEYKRDLDDWEWLCRKCHMTKDGRMNNLAQFQKSN